MERIVLRDYQNQAKADMAAAYRAGKRSPILVAPTGSGKTTMAASIAAGAEAKHKSVLILAPRRELIYQFEATLLRFGVNPGIIMAGETMNLARKTLVASFDTLNVRAVRKQKFPLPPADIVIIDEAHLTIAATRRNIIKHYQNMGALVIGLTATPALGSGKGLGAVYDQLVFAGRPRELMDKGYLVDAKYWSPSRPDLKNIKVVGGDYQIKGLAKVMDQPKLVGDIVKHWFRLAEGDSTVVFCVNREHARHVNEEFLRRGVKSEYLDGNTESDERAAILERVESGETTVLCNVFVATYGLDIPRLRTAILARPTRSLPLYIQIGGRVLRPFPGKEYAKIIDHSGAVLEHGFLDEEQPWDLDPDDTVKDRKERQKKEKEEPKEIECSQCHHVFKSMRVCPNCGHEMISHGTPVPTYQSDLKELKRDNRNTSWEDKRSFYGAMISHAQNRSYKKGWAAWAYREKFGVWPNDPRVKQTVAGPISKEHNDYIKYLQIRNAKRRQAS